VRIEVQRYEPSLQSDWTAVLKRSRNGLFLFDRAYMEYHADRFPDFSVIAYSDGEPMMLFPATKEESSSQLTSHSGLTFGGFILAGGIRADVAIEAIDHTLHQLRNWGVTRLTVKPVPLPFCTAPSQDAEYALWRRGFTAERRDLSSLVLTRRPLGTTKSKMRDAVHAQKLGVTIGEAAVAEFYPLLSSVLRARHGADPVHSEDELRLLQERFPDRIHIMGAFLNGALAAGAVVFRYDAAWHTQYLANGPEGRQSNALDLLILDLVEQARAAGVDAVSLGTSMQQDGLNPGLLWQKESFGARAILHDVLSGQL
jgi:hypothetical protein